MKKTVHKIPHFKNDVGAALFWDSHDSTDFLSQTKAAHLAFPKPRHKIVIDLHEKEWQALIRLASIRRLPYTNLLENIIFEKLSIHN